MRMKEWFFRTLRFVKEDRVVASTIAICLTMFICTGILYFQLQSIYLSIPDDSSSDISEIDNKLDDAISSLQSIDEKREVSSNIIKHISCSMLILDAIRHL